MTRHGTLLLAIALALLLPLSRTAAGNEDEQGRGEPSATAAQDTAQNVAPDRATRRPRVRLDFARRPGPARCNRTRCPEAASPRVAARPRRPRRIGHADAEPDGRRAGTAPAPGQEA